MGLGFGDIVGGRNVGKKLSRIDVDLWVGLMFSLMLSRRGVEFK